jgi:hypothetical protein
MRKSQQLHEPLATIHKPIVLLHERHNTYCGAIGRGHEAGYDSWMTMGLFIKLCAQLAHAASKVDTDSTSESFGPFVANVEEEDVMSFGAEDGVKRSFLPSRSFLRFLSGFLRCIMASRRFIATGSE